MDGWGEYLLAWAAFLGAHIVPAMPRIRAALIARLGRKGYLAGFSLLSLALLIWLIRASGAASYIPLWEPGGWSRWLVNLAMPLAILTGVLAAGMSGLITAFAIWAAVHLVANGDLAHVILFGGMLVFALTGLRRSGVPRALRLTWPRLILALGIWAALLLLHLPVVGLSPLPG